MKEKIIKRYPNLKSGERRVIRRTINYNYQIWCQDEGIYLVEVISKICDPIPHSTVHPYNLGSALFTLSLPGIYSRRLQVLRYLIDDFKYILEE